ncbi:hypothetical protein TSAR_002925 [Trichomalopsis sarcophagae]|uniref:Uncharacterized protein n=1 Tax=Trichomalopsis sarcophagae TaxID=543379 RepID=A0A232FK81_9HYME|nr:hypothetical protein TSAR_002925 [Trichomalopsis sarcophagae]
MTLEVLNITTCRHLFYSSETLGSNYIFPSTISIITQLADNISASNRLLDANKLLLDENIILRDELQQTKQILEKLHRASQDLDTDSLPVSDCSPLLASSPSIIELDDTEIVGTRKCSSPQMTLTGEDAGSGLGVAEGCEVIIHGLVQNTDNINEKISGAAAFALLSTVLPALQMSDVAGTRVLSQRQRRLNRDQSNDAIGTNSATRRGVLPSVVVTLASPGLVTLMLLPLVRSSWAAGFYAINMVTCNFARQTLIPPSRTRSL